MATSMHTVLNINYLRGAEDELSMRKYLQEGDLISAEVNQLIFRTLIRIQELLVKVKNVSFKILA